MKRNDPFPGDWYAAADRPSAPSAACMLAESKQAACSHPDDDRQPGPRNTWFCEACGKPALAEPEWSKREALLKPARPCPACKGRGGLRGYSTVSGCDVDADCGMCDGEGVIAA